MPRMGMRHGQRGWRWGCPRRVEGFIEPSILLALHEGPSYGYKLVEKLEELGFAEVPVDLSLIYRYLRSMEARGLISSKWQEKSNGPPRRIYEITEEGDFYLQRWMDDIERTKSSLETFLSKYKGHMEAEHSKERKSKDI